MPKNMIITLIFIVLAMLILAGHTMANLRPIPPPENATPRPANYLPEPDEFVPVEQLPEMIYEEVPVYPELAKKVGMEAELWIKCLVDKKGNVIKAMILKSSGNKENFDKAALDAAYKNKFKPALQNSQPVAVWITYKVDFVLSQDEGKDK
jgi:protein TonB